MLPKPKEKEAQSVSVVDIFHNKITAWLVLGASLLITLAGWYISNTYVEKRAADRFLFEVDTTVQAITKRMQEYEQVLRGGVGLFKASKKVDRAEFHAYVSNLLIDTYWPGIQGIGYAEMIMPDEREAHEAAIKAEGFAQYQINPPGQREQYSAIIYLEPFSSRNMRAFGYDMYSNPIRREAMQRAAETGEPAMSGRVTLVQETNKDIQAGFLVYLPLYSRNMPVGTPSERWEALEGFVYSPFRTKDLLHGILGSGPPNLDFQVYDGDNTQDNNLLYDSRQEFHADLMGKDRIQKKIKLQGRTWTLVFHSTIAFDQQMASAQPSIIASFGIIIDVLLFVVIVSLARNRESIIKRANEIAIVAEELSVSEKRLQRTHEIAKVGSWIHDLKTQNFTCSEQTYHILDLAPGAPITYERYLDVIHPDDRRRVRTAWQEAMTGRPFNLEHRIVVGKQIKWVNSRAQFMFDENNQPYVVDGSIQDITDRKESEQALRLSSRVIEHARESIIITDADARIIEVNPMFTEITGYRREEVIGRNPSLLASGKQDKTFYERMWHSLLNSGIWEGELWNKRKDGSLFLQRISISAVTEPDSGKINQYVAMASDITEAHKQKKRLEHLALHDALTGLPNRHLLLDRIEIAIARAKRNKEKLAVAFIDLDGFKPVNDTHGHAIGDKVLVEVAKRLTQSLRKEDTVSRIGGDEFCLLYADQNVIEDVKFFLQRLLEQLSHPFIIEGNTFNLSASIGVAFYPDDALGSDELLVIADKKMYKAKEKGRNCVVLD